MLKPSEIHLSRGVSAHELFGYTHEVERGLLYELCEHRWAFWFTVPCSESAPWGALENNKRMLLWAIADCRCKLGTVYTVKFQTRIFVFEISHYHTVNISLVRGVARGVLMVLEHPIRYPRLHMKSTRSSS